MADLLGMGKCPLCGSLKARVSLTKKGLACMTCQGCQSQLFARSARSDELLRECMEVKSEPAEVKPAPIPAAPVPPAKPEKAKRGFFDIY